jgi:hypothetical protein
VISGSIETKNKIVYGNVDAYTATPGLLHLSPLSQGDDEDQRAGNRVNLKHLTLRLLVKPGEETIANHIRVVVIQWFQTTTPVAAYV